MNCESYRRTFRNSEKSKHKLSMESSEWLCKNCCRSSEPQYLLHPHHVYARAHHARGRQRDHDARRSPNQSIFKKVGGTLRRLTGTFARSSGSTYRQQACAAYARIFAGVLFPTPATGVNKASSAYDRRKIELLELFLRKDELG